MAQAIPIFDVQPLSQDEWAVLFTVSYYTPLPREQVVELAGLEVPGHPEGDLLAAVEECQRRGWVSALHGGEGLVLTEEGLTVKNAWSSPVALKSA